MMGVHYIGETLGGTSVPCYVQPNAPSDLILVCVIIIGATYDVSTPSLSVNALRNGISLNSAGVPYYRDITGSQSGENTIRFRYQVRIIKQDNPEVGNYPVTLSASTNGDQIVRRSMRVYLLTRAVYSSISTASGSGTSNTRIFSVNARWGSMQIGGALAVGDLFAGQWFDTVNISTDVLDNCSWRSDDTYGSYYRIAGSANSAILATRASWSPTTSYVHMAINFDAEELMIPLNSQG
jgi:hypothetical protein